MREDEKLLLLAEGLPIILASSEGFQAAAEAIRSRARESDVLEGFAAEEAAKALILLDMLRCPKAQRERRNGVFVRWFYDHLARLIYADSVKWRPTDKGQLRSYVDLQRRSHVTDGAVGEYIVPSGPIPERERRLYSDVERLDDGTLIWNSPRSWKEAFPGSSFFDRAPDALRMARAMQKLGMFSETGLKVVSDLWGAEMLEDQMTWQDGRDLAIRMVEMLEKKEVVQQDATTEDAKFLVNEWPLPMWDFDLSPIVVPIKELEAERERNLWREMGY
jgi:hypothetical protein